MSALFYECWILVFFRIKMINYVLDSWVSAVAPKWALLTFVAVCLFSHLCRWIKYLTDMLVLVVCMCLSVYYHSGCHGYLNRLHKDALLGNTAQEHWDHWLERWRCRSLLVPQDAICTLNTLQTNASCLEQVRRERNHPQLQLQAMKAFLERTGLTVSNSSIVQRLPLLLQAFIKLMLFPLSLSVLYHRWRSWIISISFI